MSSEDNKPRGDEPREDTKDAATPNNESSGGDEPSRKSDDDAASQVEGREASEPSDEAASGAEPSEPDEDAPNETEAGENAPSKPDDDESGEREPSASDDDAPSKQYPSESDDDASSTAAFYDDPYDDDTAYAYGEKAKEEKQDEETALAPAGGAQSPPPPPPTTDLDDEDDDEEGMARMSFLEHLEELRVRIIRTFLGLLVAYASCLAFAPQLFKLVIAPFENSPAKNQYDPPLQLTQLTPFEQFHVMYIKIPLLAGVFLAAPWVMYQAWAFISPGLYQREKKWAGPFVSSTAGLFILGGMFCYFIALRFALGFLLGLAEDPGVRPMVSLSSYFDMFFNLHIGLGIVFQMPMVIFFFTLLRITSPAFLLANVRYAILIIFVIAAIITPTPDVTTMLTFAAPMVLLFYVGIGASYLIVFHREERKIPWVKIILVSLLALALLSGLVIAVMHYQMGWQFQQDFPWFVEPAAPPAAPEPPSPAPEGILPSEGSP